ncbi:PREDICTED: transcription factor bHLH87 [Nelumbo nucifera]|uniref:Transcription factor bHLH87 n=2 Tax=Nelumbo nucifera TaxID=4432 RepID=A0A1U7YV99_NELNU|nr:PREDICTED: transcription factor bHLH87 [Nelumbo nucifera]DAD44515.1 TPA_asm: hypothetical protein HUJ06_002745 [Nelumbo nucifera]
MDCLGWDEPSIWSNEVQHELAQGSIASNTTINYGILSGKVDLYEGVFQRTRMSGIGSNSEGVNEMAQQLVPTLDSINVVSDLNLLQRQEAIRLADAALLAKSGTGSAAWGEAPTTAELCSNHVINRPCSINPLSDLMAELGAVDRLRVKDGRAGVSDTGSLESFDCLLSATNSNTDTSMEDDDISMILSDCRNLWNFNSGGAVSSGESENNGSNGSNKDMCWRFNNELDEAVSRGSSNPFVNHGRPSDVGPNSNKRSKVEQQLKVMRPNNHHYFDLLQSDSSTTDGGFRLIPENQPKPKKPRSEKQRSSNINFQQSNSSFSSADELDAEAIAQMKEMIYRAAVFRPVNLGLEVVEKPKRKNVRISSDPQTVAARHRRERISERIRVLQRLVPGGTKMDTATMLDEAANYLKFLRSQVKALETLGHKADSVNCSSTNLPPNLPFPMQTIFPLPKP